MAQSHEKYLKAVEPFSSCANIRSMFGMTQLQAIQEQTHQTPWDDVHVPTVPAAGWAVGRIEDGLRVLERIRREVDSACAALISAMPESRDAVTGLVRVTGVSAAEARRRRSVAAVVSEFPVVAGLLKAGLLSAEHVAALAAIGQHADDVNVVALWAVGKLPEDVRKEAERVRLSHLAGAGAAARQQALRRLVLTAGPEGMVAIHGLLPPKQGALLAALLQTVMDANWRQDHPERADTLGGHDVFCDAHHRHLHVGQLKADREADGTVTIRIRATGEIITRATPIC